MSSKPLFGLETISRIFWFNAKLISVKLKVYYPFDDVILGPNDVKKHWNRDILCLHRVWDVIFDFHAKNKSFLPPNTPLYYPKGFWCVQLIPARRVRRREPASLYTKSVVSVWATREPLWKAWESYVTDFFCFVVVENESESGQGKRVKISDLLGEDVAVSIFR